MNLAQIGEFGLIEKLQSGLKTRAGTVVGIGDDCAVLGSLQTPIVTMDALVEGVHFRRDWTTPRALGRKAMAVNLSDLASSGARPVAAFVSLSVGAQDDFEWIEELYQGFEAMAQEFDFTVAGGDTTKSQGGIVISIALIGEVLNPQRGPILRSGARSGDILMVSGNLGDAAAGLAILQADTTTTGAISPATRTYLLQRHHDPTPRLEWVKWLLEFDGDAIRAGLDLSDGLIGDAAHLAKRSGVSIEIEAQQLPISTPCREAAQVLELEPLELALSGGEDYELLLAIAPAKAGWILESARREGIRLTEIGKCGATLEDKAPVVIRHTEEIRVRAWTHF